MDKIYKFMYGLLGLWCFFSVVIGNDFLLSQLFKTLNMEPSTAINFIISIIIFALLVSYFDKSRNENIENNKKNLSFIAVFINTINKVNYLNLKFINNIKLNELALIEFNFKNGNQVTLKLEEVNNYIFEKDIIQLDNYLNKNITLSNCKTEEIKLSESIYIRNLINSYISNKN